MSYGPELTDAWFAYIGRLETWAEHMQEALEEIRDADGLDVHYRALAHEALKCAEPLDAKRKLKEA